MVELAYALVYANANWVGKELIVKQVHNYVSR